MGFYRRSREPFEALDAADGVDLLLLMDRRGPRECRFGLSPTTSCKSAGVISSIACFMSLFHSSGLPMASVVCPTDSLCAPLFFSALSLASELLWTCCFLLISSSLCFRICKSFSLESVSRVLFESDKFYEIFMLPAILLL